MMWPLHPAQADKSMCGCSAGMVGLAVTATLSLTGILNQLMRQLSDVEVQMNRHALGLRTCLVQMVLKAACGAELGISDSHNNSQGLGPAPLIFFCYSVAGQPVMY